MNSNNIFDARQWHNSGRWVQPTLSGAFWTHCHEAETVKEVLLGHTFHPILYLDGHCLSHVDDEKWYVEEAKKIIKDPQYAAAYYERMEKVASAIEKEHVVLLSRADLTLSEYLNELFRTYNEMAGVWWYPIVVSMAIEKEALAEGFALGEEEMLQKVAPYHRTTLLERQTQEIRTLTEEARGRGLDSEAAIQNDAALSEKINAHVREFAWFGTHHWNGEGYTCEKCIADIVAALARSASAEEEKPHAVSDGNEAVWKLLALFMYWRTHAAEVTANVVFASRGKLIEQAAKWGLDYEGLTYLSAGEISHFLRDGNFKLPENYEERKTAYGCLIENGIERIITGAELREAMRLTLAREAQEVSEIKGHVASKGGIVRGTARVMLSPKDFGRFNAGDILVANETSPDFVPLMKIAAAVVTDTGGITSHAAIISRELKKPCVTGTKIGTQVIKDGEQIEVDAERGIIRKL